MSRLFAGAGAVNGPWVRTLGKASKVMVVSERTAFKLYGRQVLRALKRARLRASTQLLPSGESAKAWPAVEGLLAAMLASGLGRDAAVVALGGGAVTDAAGFAASIYLRGVPWASLPTTLLGQLDSGLGGKTGVNLPAGKNLAGTFHEPAAVVCDTSWLRSLPERERVSGLAEALKYGLVFEPALWALIRRRWTDLLRGEPAVTGEVVRRGAAWKLRVVAKDPRETLGPRERLNFGHTLGHALEKAAGIGTLRHGEAVIWGMRAALRLSVVAAGLSVAAADEAEAFLEAIPVPRPKGLRAADVLAAARLDKKARAGKLRFVLLRAPGKAVVTDRVPPRAVELVVKELLAP